MNKAAQDFLSSQTVAVLSTATKAGQPWGAAIYYATNETLHFFFMTHKESKKYRDLKENPIAAITVSSNEEQTTVQAAGEVIELEATSEESSEAFRMLAAIRPPGELSWKPPVSKLDGGEIVVFKLIPSTLQFSQFGTKHQSQADVTQII